MTTNRARSASLGSRRSAPARFGTGPIAITVSGRGAAQNQIDHCLHTILVDLAGVLFQVVVADPRLLRPDGIAALQTDADRHIGSAHLFEQFGDDLCLAVRVMRIGHNEFQIQLGRSQEQRQRPGVVDVTADVRVENDRYRLGARRGRAA